MCEEHLISCAPPGASFVVACEYITPSGRHYTVRSSTGVSAKGAADKVATLRMSGYKAWAELLTKIP